MISIVSLEYSPSPFTLPPPSHSLSLFFWMIAYNDMSCTVSLSHLPFFSYVCLSLSSFPCVSLTVSLTLCLYVCLSLSSFPCVSLTVSLTLCMSVCLSSFSCISLSVSIPLCLSLSLFLLCAYVVECLLSLYDVIIEYGTKKRYVF